MPGQGRFITVEGGEGVGKSVFTAGLAAALRARGFTVVTTREPGGTPTADRIRALFAAPPAEDPLLMETEALLVSAARAQHVGRLVRPALTRGDWVLSDRFTDSTRVYQGALGGMAQNALESLIAFSTSGLEPDLSFLLDCDVATARARLAGRGGNQRDPVERYDHAQLAVHERLRDAYLQLASRFPARIIRLDASRPPAALLEEALSLVAQRFALGGKA